MISREYVQRLVDATPVAYYVSGNDGGRAWFPWRMNKAHAPEGTHEDMCEHFALDSNFKDDTVTNADVLDLAVDLDADAVVLADVYHDADATVAALRGGLALAADHAFDGTVVLPLQAPHADSATRLRDDAAGMDVWWAIGGLKDEPATVKVNAARKLRDALGPDAHIHGLGFGVTEQLAAVVRDDPDLLDSIDNASSASNASVRDLDGCDGKNEKMSVLAARMTARRLENLRLLTPYADDGEDQRQAALGDW